MISIHPRDAAKVIFEASRANRNRLRKTATLAIDAVPEKFQVGAFSYSINGVEYVKAAETAIVFTAAHVVTALKFGTIAVEISDAGAVTTRVNEATQTTAMAYNSAALAWAARLTTPSAATKTIIGYIEIEAGAAQWDANTDDMTDASDLTNSTFTGRSLTLRTDYGSSWEEQTEAIKAAQTDDVISYLASTYQTLPTAVSAGTYVDPIIFQSVLDALAGRFGIANAS